MPARTPLARTRYAALVALAFALVLSIAPATARANGKPIQIILTYIPGISTTGSQNASGAAELVLADGEVRLAATGLPRLDPPQRYVAWIVNTSTGEAMAVGSFNTAYTTGSARLDVVLPDPIPNKGWNLFMVTIEDTANPTRPSDKVTIAGYFPPPGTEPVPNLLPNTGGGAPAGASASGNQGPTYSIGGADWRAAVGLAALTLGAGALAGYAIGRRARAGRRSA